MEIRGKSRTDEQILSGILRIGLELCVAALDFDFEVSVGFDASCFTRRRKQVLVSVDLVLFASKASKGASALPESKLIPEARP